MTTPATGAAAAARPLPPPGDAISPSPRTCTCSRKRHARRSRTQSQARSTCERSPRGRPAAERPHAALHRSSSARRRGRSKQQLGASKQGDAAAAGMTSAQVRRGHGNRGLSSGAPLRFVVGTVRRAGGGSQPQPQSRPLVDTLALLLCTGSAEHNTLNPDRQGAASQNARLRAVCHGWVPHVAPTSKLLVGTAYCGGGK